MGIGKCVTYILTRFASPLDRDELKMDLMHVNMKSDIFPLISTIVLPKVLTLCYPGHLETLAVIIAYFPSNTIVAADGPSQRSKEAFVAKM